MSSGQDTRDQPPVDTTPAPIAVPAEGHAGALPAKGRKVRSGSSAASKAGMTGEADTGSALRSVYQRMVDETIPDEMLDLLGKLN